MTRCNCVAITYKLLYDPPVLGPLHQEHCDAGEPGLLSVDEERLELEALAQALGRSSRLAHLLNYIGEKYFAGESDQLSEYNIATEVFGRSKASFDATEDAIARVEAHRLRKRLKEFYEGPGKDHLVQLSIPPGTYVPTFTHKPVAVPPSASSEPSISSDGTGASSASGAEAASLPAFNQIALSNSKLLRGRNWLLAGLAVAAMAGAAVTIEIVFRSHAAVPVATAPHNIASAPFTPHEGAPAQVQVPLRVLAGYSGAPQSDSAGQVWDADRYVSGGGPWRVPDAVIARTSDPFIFQHWRTGDSYPTTFHSGPGVS